MSKKGTNDNVKVMVRVRPFNEKEITEAKEKFGRELPVCTVQCPNETTLVAVDPEDPNNAMPFGFDFVMWSMTQIEPGPGVPFIHNEQAFAKVGQPMLDAAFEGYNGCIFAYGQTSSGKTHSMMGYAADRGITPRLCEGMFNVILADDISKVQSEVSMSFLEIYNEQIQDLIPKDKRMLKEKLQMFNDPNKGPFVKGLSEHTVTSWAQVDRLFQQGFENRSVAATNMNATSSRSHCVVQLQLVRTEIMGQVAGKTVSRAKRSRLNLVDLAGSEKVDKSGVTGQGLKEAIGINVSLTTLGRVIDALISNQRPPYRDSVLTQLLSDSLGGNSRTTMLAALSPAAINYHETVSTLRYASRARQITNVVKVNTDPAQMLIEQLKRELEEFKAAMFEGRGLSPEMLAKMGMEGREFGGGMMDGDAMKMIEELRKKEEEEQVLMQERERLWKSEHDSLAHKHEEDLKNVEIQKAELLASMAAHQEQAEAAHKKRILDRFKMLGRMAGQKQKLDEQAKKQEQMQAKMITSRFRDAVIKGALKKLKDDYDQLEAENHSLKEALKKADRKMANLETQRREGTGPMGHGGIDFTNLADVPLDNSRALDGNRAFPGGVDPNSAMMEMGDGTLCDICEQVPAQYFCRRCGNSRLCNTCDANQHRCQQTCQHQRSSMWVNEGVIVCEFCGLQEASIRCYFCESSLLCESCDMLKHRGAARRYHTRGPVQRVQHLVPRFNNTPSKQEPTNVPTVTSPTTHQAVYPKVPIVHTTPPATITVAPHSPHVYQKVVTPVNQPRAVPYASPMLAVPNSSILRTPTSPRSPLASPTRVGRVVMY